MADSFLAIVAVRAADAMRSDPTAVELVPHFLRGCWARNYIKRAAEDGSCADPLCKYDAGADA